MSILIDVRQCTFLRKTPLSEFLSLLCCSLSLPLEQVKSALELESPESIYSHLSQLSDTPVQAIKTLVQQHYSINTEFLESLSEFISTSCVFMLQESRVYKRGIY